MYMSTTIKNMYTIAIYYTRSALMYYACTTQLVPKFSSNGARALPYRSYDI